MGAWGQGVFEDDTACDWLDQLAGSSKPAGSKLIEKAIAAALKAKPGCLEADEASMALAAAEIVSAARGHQHAELPSEAKEWLQGTVYGPPEELTKRAIQAIGRVRDDSELAELWAEAEELGAWKRGIGNLLVRLQKPAKVRAAKPKLPAKKKASKAKSAAPPSPRAAIAKLKKCGIYIVTRPGASTANWCRGSGSSAKQPLSDADMELFVLFPDLEELSLSQLEISDAGVRPLAAMTRLVNLELSKIPLTDACAPVFDNLVLIQHLNLSHTRVGDGVLQRVARMAALGELNVSHTTVTDTGVRQLAACHKLQLLNLGGTAITDSSLRLLARMPNIEQLVLHATSITAAGLKQLRPLQGLQGLGLEETAIDDAACPVIAEFLELDGLNLERTKITGAGLKRLTCLTKLNYLNLSGTALGDDDVSTLLQFPESASIFAGETRITVRGKRRIAEAGRQRIYV